MLSGQLKPILSNLAPLGERNFHPPMGSSHHREGHTHKEMPKPYFEVQTVRKQEILIPANQGILLILFQFLKQIIHMFHCLVQELCSDGYKLARLTSQQVLTEKFKFNNGHQRNTTRTVANTLHSLTGFSRRNKTENASIKIIDVLFTIAYLRVTTEQQIKAPGTVSQMYTTC